MARSRLPLSVETDIRQTHHRFRLFLRQPVAGADTLTRGAFDFGDAGGDVGMEQAVVGGFGGEAA